MGAVAGAPSHKNEYVGWAGDEIDQKLTSSGDLKLENNNGGRGGTILRKNDWSSPSRERVEMIRLTKFGLRFDNKALR